MALMNVDLPDDVNKLLRKYVIDLELKNRENATIYILKKFLQEFYKNV